MITARVGKRCNRLYPTQYTDYRTNVLQMSGVLTILSVSVVETFSGLIPTGDSFIRYIASQQIAKLRNHTHNGRNCDSA